MSVYDKVQHTMLPFDAVSQQQLDWIERIADTVTAFCINIGLAERHAISHVSFVLQTAGELLWEQSGGKPCWSQLDVNAYVSMLKDNPCRRRGMPQRAVHVLTLFYNWLGETKQLHRPKALRKVRQLLKHCGPVGQGTGSAAAAAAYAAN